MKIQYYLCTEQRLALPLVKRLQALPALVLAEQRFFADFDAALRLAGLRLAAFLFAGLRLAVARAGLRFAAFLFAGLRFAAARAGLRFAAFLFFGLAFFALRMKTSS